MPEANLLKPKPTSQMNINTPTAIALTIATGVYPHVMRSALGDRSPSRSKASIPTTKRLWEISQWRMAETTMSGIAYQYGSERK